MADRVYVRDLEVLRNLDEGLSKFYHGATDVLEQVDRSIRTSQEHIRIRTNYWQAELRRREDALRACESARDDKGRGYDCRAEAIAVRQAEEAVEKLQKLSSQLEQAVGEYLPYANRLQQLLNAKLNKAKSDLGRNIGKYEGYLGTSHISAEGSTRPDVQFDAEFESMSSAEKGNWGERALLKEINKREHALLIEHHDEPTSRGFDAVSFDPVENWLHIWEAKNWKSNVSEKDLTAWSTKHLGMNVAEIVESFPEGLARDAVKETIKEGRVSFHLRVGPKAGITKDLAEKLDRVESPWPNFDWKQYSSLHMLRIGPALSKRD